MTAQMITVPNSISKKRAESTSVAGSANIGSNKIFISTTTNGKLKTCYRVSLKKFKLGKHENRKFNS